MCITRAKVPHVAWRVHTYHATDRPPPLGNCAAHATASSFAVPSRAASYSQLWPEGLRGRRGRPARTTRTAWQRAAPPAWSAKIGTSKQASAEHRTTVCMHARHAHIPMHSAKQHRMPGMRYKASSALGTGRLCHVRCSRRPCLTTSKNVFFCSSRVLTLSKEQARQI